ncbi:restriction endonuclease subunit S [Cohnella luojiensis]|uniref:restriction endonuclease subunit S n=1 Tax=Cohnella luojiensis TaxID=652876 RepID=UPI0014322544|nr:restriction endonuclease subunit S [Cohnella luojiensis]
MSSDTVELQEVANVVDSLHKTPEYIKEGFPIIRVTDIKGGYLDLSQTLRVSYEVYEEFSKKYKPHAGDILVSRVGSYGNFSFVNFDSPFCLGQNTAIIVPKNVDNKFLYFWLTSSSVKQQIEQRVVGSTQKTLSLKNIKELRVPNLSLEDQRSISNVLSKLDENIELNKIMIHNMEEIAHALFKRWIVDFEFPNDNGEPYKSSGGETVWSDELAAEVPIEWEVKRLDDLIESISQTYKFTENQVIFLNTSDILDGEVLHEDYSYPSILPGQAKKRIYTGDILYSEIRPANKRFAYIDFDAQEYVVSTKLMVLRSKSIVDSIIIYYFLTSKTIVDFLQTLAESRSGTFPQITFQQLKLISIAIPPADLLNEFACTLRSIYTKIQNNRKENKFLSQIRDTLLPKLMSGEIRIPVEHEYILDADLPMVAETSANYISNT